MSKKKQREQSSTDKKAKKSPKVAKLTKATLEQLGATSGGMIPYPVIDPMT